MAEINVPGPLSGKEYRFLIAGDTPTMDEQLRIDAHLSANEQQFLTEYEEVIGEPLDTGEGTGLFNYLGEFPKGVARGAVGAVETALLGASAALPESIEDPTREVIRKGAYALKPQADIGLEDTVSGKFGEALGSFGPLLATAAVPGGAVIAPAMAAGMGAGEASERARAAGATLEERGLATLLGAPVGASEALLPIKLIRGLGRENALGIIQRLKRIAASAGIEGAQEAAAETAQNLIAQNVYDPDQGVFSNTGESFGYGAGVGGLVQGLLDLAIPGRRRGPFIPSDFEPEADPEAAPEAAPEAEAAPSVADIPRGLPTTINDVADDLGLPKTVPFRKKYGRRMFYDKEARSELAKLRSNPGLPITTRSRISDYLASSADLAAARQNTKLPFAPASPLARPPRRASQVLDELKVAPRAPIRKKFKDAVETDNRFLEELQRYARLPGVKKDTRTAITQYLNRAKETTPAPEPSPAPSQETPPEGAGDVVSIEGGRGESVPSPTRRVGKRGQQPRDRGDTPSPAAPADAPLGDPSADASDVTGRAGQQPGAVTPTPAATEIDDDIAALYRYDSPNVMKHIFLDDEYARDLLGEAREPDERITDAASQADVDRLREYLKAKTQERLADLPDEITVYRAGDLNERDGVSSFTLNPNYNPDLKLPWNDLRGSPGLKAYTVRKEDILVTPDLIRDFGENEVVITNSAVSPSVAEDRAAPALGAEQKVPDLRTPVVPPPPLKRQPGETITPFGQVIPAGIRPTEGRQLETQEAAQREPIAEQLRNKARLEQEVKNLEAALATRAVNAQAKEKTVKPQVVRERLQGQLNRANAQLYNVTSYLRSEAGRQQAEVEGARDAANLMERANNDALRLQLRDWFRANAPQELVSAADYDTVPAKVARERALLKPIEDAETEAEAQALQREHAQLDAREAQLLAQEAAFDSTTASDKRALLELLNTSEPKLRGPANAGARHAKSYFSKYPDPNEALAAIGHDIGSPDVPAVRKRSTTTPLSPLEKSTGRNAATAASEWVEQNLSFNSVAYMDEQIAEYTEGRADALGNTLDQEQMKRRKREAAEEKFLKTYYDAEAALRGTNTEAFEDTTPDALSYEEIQAIGAEFSDALLRAPRRSVVYGLQGPFHPDIVRALNKGDLRGALQRLADTSTDSYISQLAAALVPYVGTTKVYTTASGDAVRDLLRNKETGEIGPGGYLLRTEAAQAAAIERAGRGYAEDTQDAIFLNSATGMNAHTLLHEMIHVATIKALMDPTNPVRARLENLRKQVEPLIDQAYGLKDTLEFASEAMSNQEFQNKLAQLYPNDRKASALTQVWRTVANFVRRLLGRQARDYTAMSVGPEAGAGKDSVFDEVDFLVRTIFDAAPEVRADNSLYEDSLIPLRAEARLNGPAGRIKDFTKIDQQKIDNFLAAGGTSRSGIKRFVLDAFVGLTNMLEPAGKYLGRSNVDDLYKALTGHSGAIHRVNQRVRQTISDIEKLVPKDKIDLFNDVRLIASELQIDPRRPEEFYQGYTLAYKKLNAKGEMDGVEVQSYPTAKERDAVITDLNARLQQDTNAGKAATRTQARVHRDFDPETLDAYRKLRKQWEALGPEGQQAYNKVIALFENLHKETGRVLKARLDEMLPFQKTLSDTLYKDIYQKILADQVLVPYQPLQRQGRFWLAYFYNDPETGQPTLAKQSFLTEGDRAAEYRKLEQLKQEKPDLGIDDVRAYVKVNDLFGSDRQPDGKFILDIGRMMERQAQAASNKAQAKALSEGATVEEARAAAKAVFDAEMARASSTQQEIVKLALEMTPERSILNSYRRRENIKGYLGDKTPIPQKLSRTDTINLLMEKGSSLSRQLADIEYGAKARAAVTRMEREFEEGQRSGRIGLDEQAKAQTYLESMQDYAGAVYRDRSKLSKLATTLGFGLTLGANISSATVSFFAIPTIIAPYLSGQYGTRQTVKALGNAMRVYAGSGRERTVEFISERGETETRRVKTYLLDYSLDNYEMNENSRYYYLREEASARGLLHNSINYDTLDVEGSIGTPLWNKINKASGYLFHHLERSVRETTMIAAYDLEVQRMQAEKAKRGRPTELTVDEKKAAASKAAYTTEMTNGSISAAAAPKFAQGNIGAPFYLFRRYPLAMYNLLLTLANKSFPSKAKLAEMYGEGTPEYEEALMLRKVARFQFGGIVGSVGLWAGASGLPMYGAFGALFNTLFTEDDEEDFDTIVRTSLSELGFKGIGNYFFGTEVSSRIGLANTFYRDPLRADSQGAIMNLIEGAGGPIASLVIKYRERIPALLDEREYKRAIEAALPTAFGNMMRSIRFAQEGATTLRGDVIYDDFGPYSIVAQFMGFSSADYIRQLEANTQLKTIDTAIVARKSKLMRRLNLARRNGDRVAMQDVMDDIREYNQRHPQQAITRDTLKRSARTFEQTTQRARNGMIFNNRNLPLIRQMAEEYDSPVTFWEQFGLN